MTFNAKTKKDEGLGTVFAETFGEPSQAEVEAVASVDEETTVETPEVKAENQAPAASTKAEETETPEATETLQTKLDVSLEENKALAGQVALLKDINNDLNKEKASLQVKIDAQAQEVTQANEANEALKPAAIRQIKTLSIALNQPTASDLTEKTATELGSICASLLDTLKETIPAGKQSKEVPSGSDKEPSPYVVPSAADSGLSNF